jgi:hypothetical protein
MFESDPFFFLFYFNSFAFADLILGFIDYLAEVGQGMIQDRITVSTLVNDIGLFISMVSSDAIHLI